MAQGAGPPATPIPQLDGGYDPDHKAEQLQDTMRRLEAAETATANNYKAIYGAFPNSYNSKLYILYVEVGSRPRH